MPTALEGPYPNAFSPPADETSRKSEPSFTGDERAAQSAAYGVSAAPPAEVSREESRIQAVGTLDAAATRRRVLEFQLDATAETATLVWEFPGTFTVDPWYTNEFYLPFWGDADRLENGNVLVTAGVRGPDARSRVFEVAKADGAVVWEFQLPPDFGTCRAERLSPTPLVRPVSP